MPPPSKAKLAAALSQAAAQQMTPDADQPMPPTNGATDGLGAGQGGLAIHPNLKSAKIASYEPRHSSKHR